MRPHRWPPTRLPRPWDSPGKNTGVGCHFLLQCTKVKRESEVAQSYPTPSDPWTVAHQAPPSMGFSRQEYWSGVPLPSPITLFKTENANPNILRKLTRVERGSLSPFFRIIWNMFAHWIKYCLKINKNYHKTHVSIIWWADFVQIMRILEQLRSSKPIHLSTKLWCLMELKDRGCYFTIASWHFLELQDSTALGLRGRNSLSQRTLSPLWWHEMEGTATSFSDSHDLNYLFSTDFLLW